MTTNAQTIWLKVAEGGKWTLAEIRQAVPTVSEKSVKSALREMANSGALTEYEDSPLRYGVTPDCTVPRGLTLVEVLRAVGVP